MNLSAKDPRQPLKYADYQRLLYLGATVWLIWLLISIWFDLSDLLDKILLTAFLLTGALVLSWPVEGGKKRGPSSRA